MISIICLSLLSFTLAQKSFDRWSATVADAQNNPAVIGVDFRHHGHFTEGRAGVIIQYTNTVFTKSYPLFNATFTINPSTVQQDGCSIQNRQLDVLDFDANNGWLQNATPQQAGSGTIYVGPTIPNAVIPYMSGQTYRSVSDVVYSLYYDYNNVPRQLNVSYPGTITGQYLSLKLANFSAYVDQVFPNDATWAPPPDRCIVPQHRCNSSTAGVQVVDLYRAHDNSTWRHVLENCNAATPAGEVYFACHLSPGPYISHFRVKMSTQWNLYTECTGGNCNFDEFGLQPMPGTSYGDSLGVGREESLGNGMGDGTGQCDMPNSGANVGYWFSMNVGGMCPSGKQIGWRNCTWSADYQVVKTVQRSCLNMTCNANDWMSAGQAMLQSFKKCPDLNALLTPSARPHVYQPQLQKFL